LARNPNDNETRMALAFLAETENDPALAWNQLAQTLLMCNEFVFVD
jgi:hypothetical protein